MGARHLGPRGCQEGTLLTTLPKAQPKPQASSNRIKQPALALSRDSSSFKQPYLALCDSGYRSGSAPSTSKPGGGEEQQNTSPSLLA